jgi:hypothetical protein
MKADRTNEADREEGGMPMGGDGGGRGGGMGDGGGGGGVTGICARNISDTFHPRKSIGYSHQEY